MLLLFSAWAFAESGYLQEPSSDGKNIVFVAEDDIWIVPIEGGDAQRLIASRGRDAEPLLSSDGSRLFWTSTLDGNREIYSAKLSCCGVQKTIPVEKWKRLTWRQGEDHLLGFGASEDELELRNLSQSPFFRSEVALLDLKDLSIHTLEIAHDIAVNGEFVLWQDQGTDWQVWKGYRGGLAPEIWLNDGTHKQNLSNWIGEDTKPFWLDDRAYFLSDRNGNTGLFTWTGAEVTEVFVSEEWDLQAATPLPNGKVLAVLAGKIVAVDPKSKEQREIEIHLPEHLRIEQSFLLKSHLRQVALGEGAEVFLQYRGMVDQFSEADGWITIGRAESISKDGQFWVENGQLRSKDGTFLQMSEGFALIGEPQVGADWIAVRSQDLCLWLFSKDDSQEPRRLQRNIRFPVEDQSWSDDGQKLLFTGISEQGIQGIYQYAPEFDEKLLMIDDFSHQHAPVWQGEDILFISSSEISLHVGTDNQEYVIGLEDRVLRRKKNGELERMPIPVGSYRALKLGIEQIFLLSQDDELFRFDSRDQSWTSMERGVKSFQITENGKIIAWLADQIIWMNLDGQTFKELDLSGQVRAVILEEEWARIFEETVRLIESSFIYAENLDQEWRAQVEAYRAILPRIRTRSELNLLLKELIGDLGTSHSMVFGGVEGPSGAGSASLGAVVQEHRNGWEIVEVYDSGTELPYRFPQSVEGKCLQSIDGEKVGKGKALGFHTKNKIGSKIKVHVRNCEGRAESQELVIQGLSDDRRVRELDWMLQNRAFVHQNSDGKMGYVHLSDLQSQGLQELERWIDVENREGGLIVDLRYNGGGYYEAAALERIFRTELGTFQWSNGQIESFPYRSVPNAKRVFLVNGATQSAGEGLALGARILGANLIGTRTWGGYSSFAQKEVVDGGIIGVTTVLWGEGEIENHGVEPDILIAGEQEQLAEAVRYLLGE